ncbi:MAG: hypothetical protein Q8N60_03640, partial [Candidatus Diapherotrites archaeon]|nr:hypothetical protein [Candidatus Diapherotrites archaeon]
GLTGIPTQTDVNAGFVGFVRVDNTRDLNLALGGVTAWDGNFYTLEADYLFGSGAGLTGIPTQTDVNAGFVGFVRVDNTRDLNLALGGVTAWDGNYYSLESNYFFGSGAGLTGIPTQTDVNANFYGKLDVNAHFVPFIGSTKDVNLGTKKLVAGDANIGAVQFWEFSKRDIGGGIMYPALIPHGDAGKYGLIEGGLTVSAPAGGADVTMGLYDSTFTNSWYFTHNIADGLFSLGKNGTTAPFFISSNTAVVGDFNTTGDVNIGGRSRMINDLNVSLGINWGVSIQSDVNRLCFPSNSCEMYIDFNGTAFVFGS